MRVAWFDWVTRLYTQAKNCQEKYLLRQKINAGNRRPDSAEISQFPFHEIGLSLTSLVARDEVDTYCLVPCERVKPVPILGHLA